MTTVLLLACYAMALLLAAAWLGRASWVQRASKLGIAIQRAYPFLAILRQAADETARLVEIVADDAATRRCPGRTVAGALVALAEASTPTGKSGRWRTRRIDARGAVAGAAGAAGWPANGGRVCRDGTVDDAASRGSRGAGSHGDCHYLLPVRPGHSSHRPVRLP